MKERYLTPLEQREIQNQTPETEEREHIKEQINIHKVNVSQCKICESNYIKLLINYFSLLKCI